MSEESTNKNSHAPQYIQMSYNRLSPYQFEEQAPSLSIILRSTSPEISPIEYEVPLPSVHAKEYQKTIHNIMLQRATEQTLLDALQKDTGIYIRKVTISTETAEERQATLQTLSDFGEVTSFNASEHRAVLYALTHKLPIFVEKALAKSIEEVTFGNNHANTPKAKGQKRTRIEKSYQEAIQKGLKPEALFNQSDSSDTLWELQEIQLEKLLQEAVAVENYEWAQFIKEHLEKKSRKAALQGEASDIHDNQ